MGKIFRILIAMALFVAAAYFWAQHEQAAGQEQGHSTVPATTSASTPALQVAQWLPKSTGVQVHHEAFSLSYLETFEQAEWVAYTLTPKDLSGNNFKRPFFEQDPAVESGSAHWRNYKKSGFDKGHLCPAGDRKSSLTLFTETFYTSNISPQQHDFNDGVWNRLEQKVRFWAGKYGSVYVVTGGVLNKGLPVIGGEKVAVPQYFYKVLLRQSGKGYEMIGFLVPHEKSAQPLYHFVVSVDEIEKQSGIDFFPQLDDTVEKVLEAQSSYKNWSF